MKRKRSFIRKCLTTIPNAGGNLKKFARSDARSICPRFQLQSQTLRGDFLKIFYLALQISAQTFSCFISQRLTFKVGVDLTQPFESLQNQVSGFYAVIETKLNICRFNTFPDCRQIRSQRVRPIARIICEPNQTGIQIIVTVTFSALHWDKTLMQHIIVVIVATVWDEAHRL